MNINEGLKYSLFSVYAFIHPNVNQEESAEQHEAVTIRFDEEADSSLVNKERGEAVFAMKPSEGKESIQK